MSGDPETTAVVGAVGLWTLGVVHAALTWPAPATAALFVGGAFVAFLAEAVAVARGLFEHHVGPELLGVPLYLLLAWPATVYVPFRLALLAFDGPVAVLVGSVLATAYDVLTDHRGVERGLWTYTDDLPGPRFRGVPWWNFLGWFVVSALTSGLAAAVL